MIKRISMSNSIIMIAVLIIILGTAISSWQSLDLIKSNLQPVEQDKAAILADSTSRLINRMLDYGIPFERFSKMEQVLASRLDGHKDLHYLAIVDTSENILYQASAQNEA